MSYRWFCYGACWPPWTVILLCRWGRDFPVYEANVLRQCNPFSWRRTHEENLTRSVNSQKSAAYSIFFRKHPDLTTYVSHVVRARSSDQSLLSSASMGFLQWNHPFCMTRVISFWLTSVDEREGVQKSRAILCCWIQLPLSASRWNWSSVHLPPSDQNQRLDTGACQV